MSAVPRSPETLALYPPRKRCIYKWKAQNSLQFWVPILPSLSSTDSCFPEAVTGISAVTLSELEEAEGGKGISLSCAPPTLSLGSAQGCSYPLWMFSPLNKTSATLMEVTSKSHKGRSLFPVLPTVQPWIHHVNVFAVLLPPFWKQDNIDWVPRGDS